MDCKYHPDTSASWYCGHCDVAFCMSCVPEIAAQDIPKCSLCRRYLEPLGIKDSITPFWFKLGHFFAYPFSTFIFLLSVISALIFGFVLDPVSLVTKFMVSPFSTTLIYGPLFLIWGAFITNMYFAVMEYTAYGNLDSPDYKKLLSMKNGAAFLKLFLLWMVMTFVIYKAIQFSVVLAIGLGLFFLIAYPAMNMILCMDKSLISALNPARIANVMVSIGGSYLILVGLMLMFSVTSNYGSAFFIENSSYSFGLAMSYYFGLYISFAMYHMFGYVIYQYHYELDFSVHRHRLHENVKVHGLAKAKSDNSGASSAAAGLVEAQVFIQEGRYEEAEASLVSALKQDDSNEHIYELLYKLFKLQGKDKLYVSLCEKHLKRLFHKRSHNLMRMHYLNALSIKPDYIPKDPEIVHYLIKALNRKADVKPALALLNYLRREHVDFKGLADACFCFGKLLTEKLDKRQDAAKIIRWGLNVADDKLKPTMQNYLKHLT